MSDILSKFFLEFFLNFFKSLGSSFAKFTAYLSVIPVILLLASWVFFNLPTAGGTDVIVFDLLLPPVIKSLTFDITFCPNGVLVAFKAYPT